MNLKKIYLGLGLAALFFTSCTTEEEIQQIPSLGTYDKGVLVVNEGNFGTPNGSISFLSNDFSVFQNGIYWIENNNEALGDVVQSISFSGDKAFIVVNASNIVQVVNRYSFKKVATITEGLNNPRYSTSSNGKLFVTNSGTKSVSVYDLSTYAFITNIAIDKTVEKIVAANNKIYVQNGAFGGGSNVTVINAATNVVSTTIEVGVGVNSMEEKNGILYVMCGNNDGSSLYRINTESDTKSVIETTSLKKAKNMDVDGNNIWYTVGTGVYAMPITATNFNQLPLFSVADNNFSTFYGFAVIDDFIFSADANGFTQDGIMKIYSPNGTTLKTFNTKVGPNGFYLNH